MATTQTFAQKDKDPRIHVLQYNAQNEYNKKRFAALRLRLANIRTLHCIGSDENGLPA